jgi:hypothetical protein
MVVVPLAKPKKDFAPARRCSSCSGVPWGRIAAAGTLIVGGGLLLSGKRKAGLVAATTGASLALLDQQEIVRTWWNNLPGYINDVQELLGQVQETIDDVAVQREKLARILHR